MTFHSYFQLFMKSFVCQMFDQIFITHQYTLSNCWCARYENIENTNTKVVLDNIPHIMVWNKINMEKYPKIWSTRWLTCKLWNNIVFRLRKLLYAYFRVFQNGNYQDIFPEVDATLFHKILQSIFMYKEIWTRNRNTLRFR